MTFQWHICGSHMASTEYNCADHTAEQSLCGAISAPSMLMSVQLLTLSKSTIGIEKFAQSYMNSQVRAMSLPRLVS